MLCTTKFLSGVVGLWQRDCACLGRERQSKIPNAVADQPRRPRREWAWFSVLARRLLYFLLFNARWRGWPAGRRGAGRRRCGAWAEPQRRQPALSAAVGGEDASLARAAHAHSHAVRSSRPPPPLSVFSAPGTGKAWRPRGRRCSAHARGPPWPARTLWGPFPMPTATPGPGPASCGRAVQLPPSACRRPPGAGLAPSWVARGGAGCSHIGECPFWVFFFFSHLLFQPSPHRRCFLSPSWPHNCHNSQAVPSPLPSPGLTRGFILNPYLPARPQGLGAMKVVDYLE